VRDAACIEQCSNNKLKFLFEATADKTLIGKPKQKLTPSERSKHRRENNIKYDIKNTG
jgi:hypothetical protein